MVRQNGANKVSAKPTPNSNQFQFIAVHKPDDPKGRIGTRLARSHAVTRGLQNKRNLQQKSGDNFRVFSSEDGPPGRKGESNESLIASLAAESPKLQALQSHRKISKGTCDSINVFTKEIDMNKQVTEPLFSVSDELVLKNIQSILRKGLDDRALLSAVMLTFAFAVTSGCIDGECLRYQNEALSSIRQSLSTAETCNTHAESTLGAILLLAGIEVCKTLSSCPVLIVIDINADFNNTGSAWNAA